MLRSGSILGMILWLTMSGQSVWAQSSAPRTTQPVKQIEEFLKRFYYEQTPSQQPLSSDSVRALYPRRAYLLSLFDAKDGRRTTQPAYRQAIETFVTAMTETPEQPTDVYANLVIETPFRATYRSKNEILTAYWQMVHVGRALGWRLVGLTAPFLSISAETENTVAPADTTHSPNRLLTLSPNTHETSFLDFHKVIKQGQDTRLLLSDSLSQTTVGRGFIAAVRQRDLTLTETERVSVFILTRSGWVVRVDEFPRDDDNSGWLICDLYGHQSPSKLPPGLATLLRTSP